MPAFVKKPVEIEAVQVSDAIGCNRTSPQYLTPWLEEARDNGTLTFHERHVTIETLEGVHRGDWDDWIIQGVKGELYPCKPEIFEITYDPA